MLQQQNHSDAAKGLLSGNKCKFFCIPARIMGKQQLLFGAIVHWRCHFVDVKNYGLAVLWLTQTMFFWSLRIKQVSL